MSLDPWLTRPDFVFSLKSQVSDAEGLGGKLSEDDKETILAAVKEKTEWLDENTSATAEDFEDQLSELQSIVSVSIHEPLSKQLLISPADHLEVVRRWGGWIWRRRRPSPFLAR